MRKRIRSLISTSVLITLIGAIFIAVGTHPSSGQNAPFKSYQLLVFCGDPQVASATFWHDVPESSMGLKSICVGNCPKGKISLEDAISGIPSGAKAALKTKVEKHQSDAAAGKGRYLACLAKCDPDPYPDFLRKKQVSLDLFKHASDLRLTASKLVAERWGAESQSLGIEAGKEVGGDLAWEQIGPAVKWHLEQRRGTISQGWLARQGRRAAANAPFGVRMWNAIGWIDLAVQTTYRAMVTAGDWSDYQKEAQTATKQAEEMWRKALADLEASLKQVPACVEASRAAAEEEKNLDRAKAAIEKWDNNQNLYWDPIRGEAVTFEAALKRANTYLKSGQISQLFRKASSTSLIFIGDDEPSQQALAAAIRELDKATASFVRLHGSATKYLSAQRSIERELEAAFKAETNTQSQPVLPKGKSLQKKSGMGNKHLLPTPLTVLKHGS